MAFFALCLTKATVYNNREWFNTSEVRFHSFVTDGQLSLPEAQGLMDADETERRDLIRNTLAPAVLSHWNTITVENIPDRHTFEFGDTGRILFRSNYIPTSLDWFMVVVEDDSDLSRVGDGLINYLTDERVDRVAKGIVGLTHTTMNPATAATIILGKELLGGISFVLRGNPDDQLGVVEQSFIRAVHYPRGAREAVGVQDLSGNMWYDYFLYGTNEV